MVYQRKFSDVCFIVLSHLFSGNFYVCQALQNVTEKAVKAQKNFRIRWLEIDQPPNVFKVAYDDLLDPLTVIGEVLLVCSLFSRCSYIIFREFLNMVYTPTF